MELQKMTSEPMIPRKRTLAVRDFPPGCGPHVAERKPLKLVEPVETNRMNRSKPKEFGGNNNKPSVGKVMFLDPAFMKAGCDQKPKVTTSVVIQRKPVPVKNFDNDKLVNTQPVEDRKIKSFEPKELVRNKSYLATRSTPKVKFYDPASEAQKLEEVTTVGSSKEEVQREKIKEAMAMFDKVYEELSQKNRSKPRGEKISAQGVTLDAAKMVEQKLKWVRREKIRGHVCGVQIGDKFKYRAQLKMIGLHSQPTSGIDYAIFEGRNLAISVVDAHRYSNEIGSSDTLVYSGQGGRSLYGGKLPPEDQKLERGNLALKNSKEKKNPIRVIRKVEGYGKEVFVYYGLYIVDHYKEEEEGAEGKIVYKFHLNRVPGQPSLRSVLKW